MNNPQNLPTSDLPSWLPSERRMDPGLANQVALIAKRVEMMAIRMAAMEQKHHAIDSMAHDLSLLVGGYRWMRTARLVTAWGLTLLIGAAGAIKFLFPSLREWMK